MITICMNDCQINGESIPVIEVWNTLDRTTNQASIIALIPVNRDEVVRINATGCRIEAGEGGEPVVVLQ